jgi:hypothetical protein
MAYSKICVIPRCPEPSAARLADLENKVRRDLCAGHAITTKRHYGDDVEIIDTWNGLTLEDFDE